MALNPLHRIFLKTYPDLSVRSVGRDNKMGTNSYSYAREHQSSLCFVLLVWEMPRYNDSLFISVLLQFVIQGFDFIILVFTLLAEFSYFLLIFLFHLLHFFEVFLQIRTSSVTSMTRQVSSGRHYLRALV